jgi:hypothetical protein
MTLACARCGTLTMLILRDGFAEEADRFVCAACILAEHAHWQPRFVDGQWVWMTGEADEEVECEEQDITDRWMEVAPEVHTQLLLLDATHPPYLECPRCAYRLSTHSYRMLRWILQPHCRPSGEFCHRRHLRAVSAKRSPVTDTSSS